MENTGASILAVVLLSFVPGGFVTYLARLQSSWTRPVLLGLAGWALAAAVVLLIDAIRRLPPKRPIPSLSNIEGLVRDWLDRFGVGVKRDPIPTAYFRFLATLDSGYLVYIGRVREGISDYLIFRAELAPTPEQVAGILALNDTKKLELLYRIRLELARARVGYGGLKLPDAKEFHLSKRIPIRETLTEYEFIQALDEVEAAITMTVLAFQTGLLDLNANAANSGVLIQALETSD